MQRIRARRRELGLTMKQLGAIVGVSEAAISHYETGRREPDPTMLGLLANALGVTVDYLMERDEQSQAPAPAIEPEQPKRTFMIYGRTYNGRTMQEMYEELPPAQQAAIERLVTVLFAESRKEGE